MRGHWLLVLWAFGCAEIGGRDAPPDARTGDAGLSASDATGSPSDDGSVEEQTTSFGADRIVDTYLRLMNPTFNYGAGDRMCADTTTDDRRILVRVELSSMPAGAGVVSADLHIWTGALTNDLSVQTFSIYQMLEDWSEGGQSAAAGFASWNERKSGTAWTVAGAGAGSRGDEVVGSFNPTAIDTEYVIALEPAMVAEWISDPASNHGVVIVAAGSDGGCFDSTEFATAAKRPSLAITWTAP